MFWLFFVAYVLHVVANKAILSAPQSGLAHTACDLTSRLLGIAILLTLFSMAPRLLHLLSFPP